MFQEIYFLVSYSDINEYVDVQLQGTRAESFMAALHIVSYLMWHVPYTWPQFVPVSRCREQLSGSFDFNLSLVLIRVEYIWCRCAVSKKELEECTNVRLWYFLCLCTACWLAFSLRIWYWIHADMLWLDTILLSMHNNWCHCLHTWMSGWRKYSSYPSGCMNILTTSWIWFREF